MLTKYGTYFGSGTNKSKRSLDIPETSLTNLDNTQLFYSLLPSRDQL
jgi:hypothetical protein